MSRQIFSSSITPDCHIKQIMGNLRLKGWEQPQIVVDADPNMVDIHEEADTFTVNCRSDCEIRLPHGASIEVGEVHGDAQFRLLDERLLIGSVHGSLAIRNVPGVSAQIVHGDLSARNIPGDLEIGQVDGDVDIRQLEGTIHLDLVNGNLNLQQDQGSLNVVVKGDARIRLDDLSRSENRIEADGDVRCSVPADAGLKLSLTSNGESISLNIPGYFKNYNQNRLEVEIGGGGTMLEIIAGGDIRVEPNEPGLGADSQFTTDFGEEIARQVQSQIGQQMEEVSQRLKAQMERLSGDLNKIGMAPEETQRIIEQAMRTSERETARAQEKMRRAQEKLERKLDDARRKVEQKARATENRNWARSRHSWGREPFVPPAPQKSAGVSKTEVTEEERLMVLQMLEQKKISLEEADALLSALEGKQENG